MQEIGIVAGDTANEITVVVLHGSPRSMIGLRQDNEPVAILNPEQARQLAKLLEQAAAVDDIQKCAKERSYVLSENQKRFIVDAVDQGYAVDYDYSGRNMMGAYCPAVRCDSPVDFCTKAKTLIDGMGRGVVIYARY